MVVVDASALIEWFLGSPAGTQAAGRLFAPGEAVYAPELVYAEVAHGLRRLVRAQMIPLLRAEESLDTLLDLQINTFSHTLLLHRVWQLRDTLSAYDAFYVSMAEALQAPLITCDRKLASAHGHSAQILAF